MGYGLRDGDIISLANEKAGALTMSVDLFDYKGDKIDPEWMWRHQSNIRTVVNFKTRALAGVPFHLYDRDQDGGRTRNYEHRLAKALQLPQARQGQSRWVQQLMHDMGVYGRWACAVVYDDDGSFTLQRLPAERLALVTDGAGQFEGIAIRAGGQYHVRGLDDVIFDVSPGPTGVGDKYLGYSDLEALVDLALELSGLSEYRANLFRNSAMVPAVIERPVEAPKWSDDAWGRFKAEFKQYRAGGGNAGGTPLLEDGMKLKPVDVFNPKDAQYVQVRELALIEAAQVLGIPPELVGAREGTHSNIVALREQLYQDVLGSDIAFFEDALNTGLARIMGEGQYVEANLDSKLRGSLKDRADIYRTAGGRPWLTVNEIRAMENKPAIEGGDELVTPLNVADGSIASPDDTAPVDNTEDAGGFPKARSGVKAAAPPKNKWAKVDQVSDAAEVAIVKWWRGYARALAGRFGIDLDAGPGEKGRKALPEPVEAITAEEAEVLAQTLLSHTKEAAAAGAEIVFTDWNPDDLVNFDIERQRAWLHKATENEVLRFDRRMTEYIAQAMQDPEVWEDALRTVLTNDADIAGWMRGLASEAASFGTTDAARALGLTQKTWWTTSKKPRKSHALQNGLTVGIDDVFPNSQRYPGDYTGDWSDIVNCQCRLDVGA